LRGLLWLGCVSCAVLMARGQEVEPPDAEPPGAEEPAAAPQKTEPSPLVGEPQSPEELLESTLLMVDVAGPDLARFYLDKLTAEPLDDDTLLALHDKFGAAAFLRLAGVPDLQPRGRNLLDRMNVVLARHAADPERVARLLDELQGDP